MLKGEMHSPVFYPGEPLQLLHLPSLVPISVHKLGDKGGVLRCGWCLKTSIPLMTGMVIRSKDRAHKNCTQRGKSQAISTKYEINEALFCCPVSRRAGTGEMRIYTCNFGCCSHEQD